MDIVKPLKEKALEIIALWLITSVAAISGVLSILLQQIFPGLTLDKIEKLSLLRLSLFLWAVVLGLVAWLIYHRPRFLHYGNLLWLPKDPVPFCPRCKETDKKTVHMQPRYITDKETGKKTIHSYKCPNSNALNCYYNAPFSEHPKLIKGQ